MGDTGRRLRALPALAAAIAVALAALTLSLSRPPPGPDGLEERAEEVASGLRCPVCRNLSVADSPSPLAREMRSIIAERLRAGESPEAIRAYFADRYGEWILLRPKRRGLGWLPWVAPGLALAAGSMAVAAVLRRGRPEGGGEVSEADRARIARELALFEEAE